MESGQAIRGHRWTRGFQDPLPEFSALRHLNEAYVGPDYYLPPHRHPTFELSYIADGTGEYAAGGEWHRLRPGDLYITRPDELHSGRTDPTDPHHNLALGLDPGALPVIGPRLGEPSADLATVVGEADALDQATRALGARVISGAQGVEGIFWRLFDELERHQPPGGRALQVMMVQTLLIELLLFTARCYAANLSSQQGLPGMRVRSEIREVAAWLKTRLADPPTLAEMAAQAGMSTGHFAALYRQQFGASPLEHLTRMRIEEAARRLRTPRAPAVTELALELGFSSSQYFSVVFRRHKGCSPSRWRRASA